MFTLSSAKKNIEEPLKDGNSIGMNVRNIRLTMQKFIDLVFTSKELEKLKDSNKDNQIKV